MIILGINAFHADSAAALVRDGVLIAAAEEERFCRMKHWAGFPSKSIAYCLKEAEISLDDVHHVAVNQNNFANIGAKLTYALTNLSGIGLAWHRARNRRDRQRIPNLLQSEFGSRQLKAKFHNVEHHMAHLSSAFYVSPFNESIVVSIDGFGDFGSTAWGIGKGNDIEVTGRVLFPHSLGIFYQALTQYLGFGNYGDEYKVMGLAPYGRLCFEQEMSKLVRLLPGGRFELGLEYFKHTENDNDQWVDRSPVFADLFSTSLEELLGPRRRSDEPLQDRHKDIAHSVQATYEAAFFHLLGHLQEESRITNIALAGGCAANSVANGKIRRRTRIRRVYVQSAPGDAGGAIGAAFCVWRNLRGERSFVMDHAYWGPKFDNVALEAAIEANLSEIGVARCTISKIEDEDELCRVVAGLIADGRVVGWFQGRMEWGPRALGNRSILCDPRRSDMKDLLNSKIKRRESFRPFAPSILSEEVSGWFEEDDAVPFMMQVFQVKSEKRNVIPAVTHVDGSGRLQTVSAVSNPLYHRLIKSFFIKTGVPMLLNTSFNENEPVVCEPQEALSCFLRTNMDVLVLGNTVISRS
jgi:carbamoyltransferase